MSDAELVARARKGDQTAFGELIDRHRVAVYRATLAALGSHADAEDAAQDAFLTAYRRLDTFRGEASFKTWLLTIAWHQAINRRRSLSRIWRGMVQARTTEEAEVVMSTVAATSPTPEQSARGEQLRRRIRDAIHALSPKLRDTLLLAQSGDYSYEEIGAILKTPLGTVKWRVSEARRLVRRALEAWGYDTAI
ncbi:MAG TPA: sigma-70 family RNA polymerase sigma factor [Vicinamibacterales bacterium]